MAAGGRPQLPGRSLTQPHIPTTPSTLRQSHTPAGSGASASHDGGGDDNDVDRSDRHPPLLTATESSPLLGNSNPEQRGLPYDAHGTFTPRPLSPAPSYQSSVTNPDSASASEGSASYLDSFITSITGQSDRATWRRRWARKMRSKRMRTSTELAEQHGLKTTNFTYLAYYVPCLQWMSEYKLAYLHGDLIAAITLAGIYLPMSLSLAENVAHVPPIHGLYAFVFAPLLYALLGSCPQMIVGPEAAGSLLVGTVVKSSIELGRGSEDDDLLHAKICGVVSGMAAATVLIAGLARLGFLDSVLSRPFLRGFISAIGFVIFVEQLIPELGLSRLSEKVSHGSTVDKVGFIFRNLKSTHRPTFIVAAVAFVIIMTFRETKRRLEPRYPKIAFLPDRLAVVVLSAWMAWYFDWQSYGIEVLGPVKATSGGLFTFRWPFQPSHMTHIKDAMSTSFLIALLGFFESSVAAKSLGGQEIFPRLQLSPNRELVALGASNMLGACFMSLPAFGGYGRSKVNKQTGAKSPMSSIFLSMITVLCIIFLLPYFYYLPQPVLCAMISVVAWSLIEEAPHDITFFWRISAWKELGLMFIIVVATVFYTLDFGMAIGIGLSLLQVIRNSTRPRIQILGRIPGTERFENAEHRPERLEFIEGCLIVKIPEPLTFANTGELKTRLRRLELYGTSGVHPALPRLRREAMNRNIVFDVHGVTAMDGSGTQVLAEIVREYRARGVRVWFCRVAQERRGGKEHPVWRLMRDSGIVDLVGGERHFVGDVQEALRMTEVEDGEDLGVADGVATATVVAAT